jgi:hypothetical protein
MKNLKRRKRQEDYEAEEKRLREEALAEKRKNPWVKEIANCEDLLSYCKLLQP